MSSVRMRRIKMISRNLIQFVLLVSSLVIFAVHRAEGDKGVSFVQEDTNPDRKPTHDRKPFESDKCKAGEWLYPGDNEKDWACDCKPTFLYYPKTSTCYEAFSKGPCASKQMLVLPKSKVVPECVKNDCNNGKVSYKSECLTLEGPCHKTIKELKLVVSPKTLQLECGFSRVSLGNRVGTEDEKLVENLVNFCLPGGMRAQSGDCATE